MKPALILLILVSCLVAGCHKPQATATAPTTETAPATSVRVENEAFLDMNIYVYSGSSSYRLGTVTGHSSAIFVIPKHILFGSTPLRFRADPIGGQRLPFTEEITVVPGDQVTLRIPPA